MVITNHIVKLLVMDVVNIVELVKQEATLTVLELSLLIVIEKKMEVHIKMVEM